LDRNKEDRIPATRFLSSRGNTLLRDANNYTYRVHQANAEGDKVWYRCQYRLPYKCYATAVYIPAEGVIERLVTEHSHDPLVLKETIRYVSRSALSFLLILFKFVKRRETLIIVNLSHERIFRIRI
jgi:hypothetical protein